MSSIKDRDLKEIFKGIKLNCEIKNDCEDCIFYKPYGDYVCQIAELTKLLSEAPKDWDIDAINKIIDEK